MLCKRGDNVFDHTLPRELRAPTALASYVRYLMPEEFDRFMFTVAGWPSRLAGTLPSQHGQHGSCALTMALTNLGPRLPICEP